MIDAIPIRFEMTEQHGGIGFEPGAVDPFGDFQPALAGDLLRADLFAHLLGEDFGAAAGHGIEPGLLEFGDHRFDRLPADSGEVIDLHGGKGLEVQARVIGFDRRQHFQIKVEGELGVQSADHVDFGGSGRARLGRLGQDLVEGQGVAPFFPAVFGKSAKGAAVDADIGVVDVAIDVEIDPVAVFAPVGRSRQLADGQQVVAAEQLKGFGIGNAGAVLDLGTQIFKQLDHDSLLGKGGLLAPARK